MLELPHLTVRTHPFPYAVQHGFLPAALYRELSRSFPTCPPVGGPTGFSSFRGDAHFEALLRQSAPWREFVSALQSQSFIEYCMAQFSSTCLAQGCLIDLTGASYRDHLESRIEKAQRNIEAAGLAPEHLWVRADILQGRLYYERAPHLDHRRRLLSMLIYFCDRDEMDMEGGELVLHGPPECGRFTAHQGFAPRHNLMVAFPCSGRSFHSVTRITRQRSPRNFLQITVSSCADLWPSE